jgi:two-component system, cell cycle sensor histidine kinase and response regulator CckA
VRLSVRDSGAGMTPEVRARVFEPFFTTKPAGQGAGLGLSAIYGIVSQHRGSISVQSEEGTGTCFDIDLPYASTPAPVPDETPPMMRTAGGDEWILVVEDDARLRSLAEQILATRGYQVLGAGDGREAAAQIEKHGAKLSLLLTDVVLPDTNGRVLANRALKACPALSVIYMSGYIDEVAILCSGDTPQAFLGKPFTAVGLLELVRSTLDTARARVKTGGG